MNTPKFIILHHTGVSHESNPDQWEATDKYHKSKGWGGGGYNYEINVYGGIHQFREDGAVTVAQYQEGMNDGRAISICLDGCFDTDDVTREQMRVCRKLILDKMDYYSIPAKNVMNHRYLAPYKTCPGTRIPDDVYDYFINYVYMQEFYRDIKTGSFYFIKKNTKQKQKIETVAGLLTLISREFGVNNVDTKFLDEYQDTKFF